MTKTHSTKRSLVAAALVLCLCLSTFIGTTFAWFTDSATSANNKIQTGTLDVEMGWTNANEDPATATYKDASKGAIFQSDLWEPGYVEARHIKISNEGTLALKYKLYVKANGTVSELANVIDVYYYDPAQQLDGQSDLAGANKIGTLADVLANFETTAQGTLEPSKNHTVTIALKMQESAGNEYQDLSIGSDFSIVLVATQLSSEKDSFGDDKYDDGAEYPEVFIDSDAHDGEEATELETTNVNVIIPAAADEGTYTLEASEPSKAVDANGNTTLTLDITLKKDGVKVTEDGTVYDVSVFVGTGLNLKGVTHNGESVNVYTYDDVTGIVSFTTTHFSPFAFTYDLGEKAESAESLAELAAKGGIIQLDGDVALNDSPIVIKNGVKTILNLNGYTLSGKSTSSTTSYLIKVENGGELIIQDGTVSFYATTPDTEWGGEGQPPFPGYANNTISAMGKVILNNATVENLTSAGGASYAIDAYQGSDVIVNDGSVVNGYDKIAIRMFANSDKLATNVTVNGGKVTGYRAVWLQLPGSKGDKKIANLTVNGGVLESTDDVYNDAVYSYSYGDSFACTTITLNGGKFIGHVAMSGGTKLDRETIYVNWAACEFEGDSAVFYYTSGDPVYVVAVDTAEELKAAVEAGNIATLTADISLNADTAITVANGKHAIVDLNGYTVSGTSSKTGNVDMFLVKGALTIANGTVELAALNNQGWSYMTTAFDVTAGGVLNIENATVENLGGTDMAFCVHLNNWGEVTLNATDVDFKSTYVGIRAFNSGNDMNNVTLTDCDILTGNSCIWVHNWTLADFGNDEAKTAAHDALLNFNFTNVSVARTNGSKSLIRYGFTNAIYYSDIEETEVVAGTVVALQYALDNGKNVLLNNDITIAAERSNAYGATAITVDGQILDGNGYTLTVTGANGTWDSGIFVKSGTVKNLTVNGAFRGIFTSDACNGDIYIDTVEFKNVVYTFNSDGTTDTREGAVYISNSKLNGWTSFSDTHEIVVFENCTFGEGSGYAFCRPYNKVEFNNCVFEEGYVIDTTRTNEITFNNCTGLE